MAEMMTSSETFPVLICDLPKAHFPEVKDVEILVKNTLKKDKKSKSKPDDGQLSKRTKSSEKQKKDPQQGDCVLPPGIAEHIYFPVHRGVLVPEKSFGEIADGDVNDDTHCDAVVEFCSEKDQQAFCNRSTQFQVGPLYKAPRKVTIELMLSDYNIDAGHIQEIARKCRLLVKPSGTGICKMRGKDWQMKMAVDHIDREGNAGENLDPAERRSGEDDSGDDNQDSHSDKNNDLENGKLRQKDETHPPAEVRCHSESNAGENLDLGEGRSEQEDTCDDNQDSHSDNNDGQHPGNNDDLQNEKSWEKDVAHAPATTATGHSECETDTDLESGSGNRADSSGQPSADAKKKIPKTEWKQDQIGGDHNGINTKAQPLTNPCPNGEKNGNNEQDVLQVTENNLSMETAPAIEKDNKMESTTETVTRHDTEDSEEVECASIPRNVLSPRTQQKADQINGADSGKTLVEARQQVTTKRAMNRLQDETPSTDRTIEEKTQSVQNEKPNTNRAKPAKTNSTQKAKTPANKKAKTQNPTVKVDSSQHKRHHCQGPLDKTEGENRPQNSIGNRQSPAGIKDEPSDQDENQPRDTCGEGVGQKTVDDGLCEVHYTVNPVFWEYIRSHEDGFWTKLHATCLENDVHIPTPDTDGILKIRGPDEMIVNKIQRQIHDGYAGFEFNLDERDITTYYNVNTCNEETLKKQFPKIVFRRTDTAEIHAVGLDSELQQCIEVIQGNFGVSIDAQIVEQKNKPIKPSMAVTPQQLDKAQSSFRSTDSDGKIDVMERITSHMGAESANTSASTTLEILSPSQQPKSGTVQVEKNIFAYIRTFHSSQLKEIASSGLLQKAMTNNSVDVWFAAGNQEIADECRDAFLALYLQTKDSIYFEKLNTVSKIPDEVMMDLKSLRCITQMCADGMMEITCDMSDRDQFFKIVSGYIVRKRPSKRILKDTSFEEETMKSTQSRISPDAANSPHPVQHNDLSYPCGFRLYDHTEVYIHKCSITKLMVDAIVNAANAPLQHGGGIAKVIADAAGPSLTEEGYTYIRKHGDLQDSEVAVTTAGWLPCKKVIHAVGPQWPSRPNRMNKDQCIALLKTTFLNVLKRCSQENFRSVAIPAISSGVYRVPLEHVADCMCSAMVEGLSERSSLQEVHLIDISDQMLHLITHKFSMRLLNKSMSPTDLILLPSKEVEDKINKQKITLPAGFCLHGRMSLYIHKCDITILNVDAIVNPTDNKLRHYSGLSAQIANAAGKTMFSECQAILREHRGQISDSGVVVTSAGGRLMCREVFHVVPPKWPSNRFNTGSTQTERDRCWKFLELTYINILTAAGNCAVKAVALPPVGTGFHGVPADIVAWIICEKILEHTKTESYPTSIHLVDFSSETVLNLVIKQLHSADPNIVEAIDKHRVSMFLGGGITKPAMHRQYSPPAQSPGGAGSKQSGWDDSGSKPTSSVRGGKGKGGSSQSPGVRINQPGWDGFANKPRASVTDGPDWEGSSVDHDDDSPPSTGGNTHRGARPKMTEPSTGGRGTLSIGGRGTPSTGGRGTPSIGGRGTPSTRGRGTPSIGGRGTPSTRGRGTPSIGGRGTPSTGGRGTSQGANNGPHSSSFRHNDRTNTTNSSSSGKDKYTGQDSKTGAGSDSGTMKKDDCCICLSVVTAPKVLPCKHVFCTDCIDESFRSCGPRCPVCGQLHGVLKGTQPDGGKMVVRQHRLSIPGYEGCGAIMIDYDIPDGTQNAEHPNPGKRYFGTHRTAYLPNNQEGNEILHLLQRAFDNRLIFTIGRSSTTGQEDQVTWNDIHHKTSVNGRYGYPDPGYLQRVRQELADKGIK